MIISSSKMRARNASSVLVMAVLAFSAAMVASPAAEASPRFKVTNNADKKVNVYIFRGDDPFCSFSEKLKSVSVGETDEYGCTGAGKGQCKVQFYAGGNEICKSDHNTCSSNAIKVDGKSTVTITKGTADYVCDIS